VKKFHLKINLNNKGKNMSKITKQIVPKPFGNNATAGAMAYCWDLRHFTATSCSD